MRVSIVNGQMSIVMANGKLRDNRRRPDLRHSHRFRNADSHTDTHARPERDALGGYPVARH